MRRRNAYRWIVLTALIVGVAIGVAILPGGEVEYGFVRGARPMRVAEYVRGSTRGILRIYNVHLDWRAILGMAEKESSPSIVETGTYEGLVAATVIVPQTESGRARLFETPVREITVIQGKFVRDKSGVEIARPSDGTWSGVRIIEFRRPRFLDTAGEWLRGRV